MTTVNVEMRENKSGIKYRARVRLRSELYQRGYYEESKTFASETMARNWGNKRKKILEKEGVPKDIPSDLALREISFAALINMYLEEFDDHLGRSKKFALKAIAKRDIGIYTASHLTVQHIIEYVKERNEEGVSPYTAYQDLLFMKSVLEVASDEALMVNATPEPVLKAIKHFKSELKNPKSQTEPLIEFKAKEREILPSKEEMDLLREALKTRQQQRSAEIPYLDILDIAITTCMRVSEICRVKWKNFNTNNKTLTIEDRKHPRFKKGNHQTIPLIGGAYEILMERRENLISELKAKKQKFDPDAAIFPYNARSVTAGWQRVRKKLIEEGHDIQNIRFHDLRAYGASLLLEKNWSLAKVSKVTGHRDINVLNNIYNRMEIAQIAEEDFQARNSD